MLEKQLHRLRIHGSRRARYARLSASAALVVATTFLTIPAGTAASPGARTVGLVYVSDPASNVVDIFNSNGTQVGRLAKGLNAPSGLFIDRGHNLWVANPGAGNVLVFP